MKTIVFLMAAAWILAGPTVSETRTITGTVTAVHDGVPIAGVRVQVKGTRIESTTNAQGVYEIAVPLSARVMVFTMIGFESKEVSIGKRNVIDVSLTEQVQELKETVVTKRRALQMEAPSRIAADQVYWTAPQQPRENTEEYASAEENTFHGALAKPLSTFSIDVDVASYANIRRFIRQGQRPPAEAVRIEEMINYFSYDYAQPTNGTPFRVHTEIGVAPWNRQHHLVRIGLQGKQMDIESLPPANLVFLIDVSGSMNAPAKLPLVKQSFRMLLDQLRDDDHVAIAVYAGAAGVVLEPTPAKEKRKILAAIEGLAAGGSTAGAAGLRLAYTLAEQRFNPKGNNRVILATDGDFNVGESSDEAMERLITEKRKTGIYLTVLGFGMGNLKDAKMEILADKGNGNYAYIDNLTEARKVLVSQMAGTLFTIASDVKIQVEFNPARVQAWRLIGYENRQLRDEDFNNDRKDAGELGAGHTVTALYEIIPVGVKSTFFSIDPLKYQSEKYEARRTSDDWLTVKLRYKLPGETRSAREEYVLRKTPVALEEVGEDFQWCAAVAAFGMLLKDSPYVADLKYEDVVALARRARGRDTEGYRAEFINLVETCMLVP